MVQESTSKHPEKRKRTKTPVLTSDPVLDVAYDVPAELNQLNLT
jgi:hypothetical protein